MEQRAALIARLNTMTATLGGHRLLAALGSNQLSKDEWRAFAAERYLASLIFEPLLDAALAKATEANDAAIADAVARNRNDELGIAADGTWRKDLAHAAWRKDFYDALGITDAMLNAAIAGPAAKAYIALLRDVLNSGDYLVMAGALLALERFLPVEFIAMRKGRDTVFADVFVDQPADDATARTARARGRVYLDDHITHDANAHYPDLLAAITPHMDNPADAKRIFAGIEAIERAKLAFYDNIAQN